MGSKQREVKGEEMRRVEEVRGNVMWGSRGGVVLVGEMKKGGRK